MKRAGCKMKAKNKNIISIRLDDETLQKLKDDAKKEYRTLAGYIRKILLDHLDAKDSGGEWWRSGTWRP